MTRQPILIIGGTGTVGSEIVRQLVADGQRVRALVRDPGKAATFGDLVEVAIGDLAQPETLPPAFSDVETAFVLLPPVAALAELEGNAFVAAAQAGVKRIVKLSNFGAGTLAGPPWEWHGASEEQLRALDVPWTILRPTRFMSNTPYAWRSVQERGEVVEAIGEGKITVIDPRDIAAAAVRVLTTPGHEGQIYELTGEALTGDEMAAAIAAVTGKPVRFVNAPEEIARQALLAAGFPTTIADLVLRYYATAREGRWYATSTLATLLGRPGRTFREWLHDQTVATSVTNEPGRALRATAT